MHLEHADSSFTSTQTSHYNRAATPRPTIPITPPANAPAVGAAPPSLLDDDADDPAEAPPVPIVLPVPVAAVFVPAPPVRVMVFCPLVSVVPFWPPIVCVPLPISEDAEKGFVPMIVPEDAGIENPPLLGTAEPDMTVVAALLTALEG